MRFLPSRSLWTWVVYLCFCTQTRGSLSAEVNRVQTDGTFRRSHVQSHGEAMRDVVMHSLLHASPVLYRQTERERERERDKERERELVWGYLCPRAAQCEWCQTDQPKIKLITGQQQSISVHESASIWAKQNIISDRMQVHAWNIDKQKLNLQKNMTCCRTQERGRGQKTWGQQERYITERASASSLHHCRNSSGSLKTPKSTYIYFTSDST